MNKDKTMDSQKLMTIRNKIEKMNKIHHVKFFEILKNNNIPFSENRNGIFFNMNSFNDDIIDQIDNYIQYIQKQEDNLKQTEKYFDSAISLPIFYDLKFNQQKYIVNLIKKFFKIYR